MPEVSIGMPVFNDIMFVEKAIVSILNQSFGDFELLLSDDCSGDGSAEVCKRYALTDSRVKYIRHDANIGISKNMEFLLKKGTGKYFMWAANDDVWDKDFVRILKENLENDQNAVSSFCAYAQVDENDNYISGREFIIEDYTDTVKSRRIRKLIRQPGDGFGYGLFVREKIIGVKFPTWWWVNRKCAYNNIYPTLCFYLAKGGYVIHKEKVLWFNRIKKEENINHKIPFTDSFIKCYSAFALRKFNLVCFSLASVIKADKEILTAVKVLPAMFFSWFIVPVFLNPVKRYRAFRNGEFNSFI